MWILTSNTESVNKTNTFHRKNITGWTSNKLNNYHLCFKHGTVKYLSTQSSIKKDNYTVTNM
jgi:hypothetical protein